MQDCVEKIKLMLLLFRCPGYFEITVKYINKYETQILNYYYIDLCIKRREYISSIFISNAQIYIFL